MKKFFTVILTLLFIFSCTELCPTTNAINVLDEVDSGDMDVSAFATSPASISGDIEIEAPSAILMEKETGTVIYEKNADTQYEPASVTKVMTILLIVEAIESGSISLDDQVQVSEYAASMGGSQVFLEPGEMMSVHDMLKSIVVSSANDAAVAMAEYLAGSEQTFVAKMNERAQQLGMMNTNFCNCTGLLEQPEHLTTAKDIAIMSRELIQHEFIKDYTTIWMDSIRDGEFGLSNTNKLIYYYDGATGLKTGFTQSAGYCLSATALRDGIEYIAVIMHCETSQQRFESAKALLSYGFANYALVDITPDSTLSPIKVRLGTLPYVQPELQVNSKLLVEKVQASQIQKEVTLEPELTAPIQEGQKIGTITISSNGETLQQTPIIAKNGVARLSWGNIYWKAIKILFAG